VSPGAVSRYLSGTRGTNVDYRGVRVMEKLASALGVSPEYFLEYRAYRVRKVTFADPELVDAFYNLMVETASLCGSSENEPDDPQE
jgi:hypothetical protein